jgi:hypothetical protein
MGDKLHDSAALTPNEREVNTCSWSAKIKNGYRKLILGRK